MASWHSRLVAHIQRHKRYPAGARDSGTAVVAFVMDRNGRVLSRRLAGSSGSAALDRETLDLIARAQPLPRPPANAAQSAFQFAIPIRYSLR
jgi:protein TonB